MLNLDHVIEHVIRINHVIHAIPLLDFAQCCDVIVDEPPDLPVQVLGEFDYRPALPICFEAIFSSLAIPSELMPSPREKFVKFKLIASNTSL